MAPTRARVALIEQSVQLATMPPDEQDEVGLDRSTDGPQGAHRHVLDPAALDQ
jgi:hypothetical protein